jgi:tetratricopeptide (TPR) repeat protein
MKPTSPGRGNNIGLIHKQLCEWDSALACFRSVLETRQKLGLYAETVSPLMNMGIVHQKMGEWAAAEEHYRACESVVLQFGNDILLARAYIGLGNVARLQRRFPEAETHLAGGARSGSPEGREPRRGARARVPGRAGLRPRPARARVTRYHEALTLAERSAPEGDLIVEIERRRAEAPVALERLDEAERALDRATRLARLTDDSSSTRSRTAWPANSRWPAAAARRAAVVGAGGDAARRVPRALRVRARPALLARSTDDARAARTHALRACSLFAEVGSSHWQDQAEAELARLMGPSPVTAPPAPIRCSASATARRAWSRPRTPCAPSRRWLAAPRPPSSPC